MSSKIYYKTDEEVELIRESSLLVAKSHAVVAEYLEPGVSTRFLDEKVEEFIRDNGGEPAFKGYQGFPNTLCASPNEEIVHGIPNDKPLKEGDIISIDCGVLMNGFYGDSAYTYCVGDVSQEKKELLAVTKASLYAGIDAAVEGGRIGDIGYAVQSTVQEKGYGVVRELVGHGVGKELHEEPQVPNYGARGRGVRLMSGLVLAIEPMINQGTGRVKWLNDGWSVVTADGLPSAHFEHTIVVRKGKADILSSFDYVEEVLKRKNKVLV